MILTISQQNLLIIENLPLANKIAKSKKKKLSHISYDELQSAAYLGLVEAARRYQPLKNNCFPAFAIWRIIGAVRDYLRELSWGTKAFPQKINILENEMLATATEKVIDCDFFDEFLKYLPSINGTVIRYYYLENKKIAEIATILQVHNSRISQILSDSRKKLYDSWINQKTEFFKKVST